MKTITPIFFFLMLMNGCATTHTSPSEPPTTITQTLPTYDRAVYETMPEPRPLERVVFQSNHGEQVAPIVSGQTAPFQGVLLNGPAVANLEVQFTGLQDRCTIERRADLQRLGAAAVSDIERVRSAYLTQQQQTTILLHSRDEEISSLRQSSATPWLWALGGVGVGVGFFSTIYLLTR